MPERRSLGQRDGFKVGDEIIVVGKDHPHWHAVGQIIEPFSHRDLTPDLTWTVEDNYGARFAVASREIRKL